MTAHEFIEIENFDREFGLTELLPADQAAGFWADFGDGIVSAIISPQGRLHYGRLIMSTDLIMDTLKKRASESKTASVAQAADLREAVICPLVHELEVIGWLVLQSQDAAFRLAMSAFAMVLAGVLNRLIFVNHQNKMAVGLHGQVVGDTYRQLKDKAARLEKSEHQYRLLAENLEAEVVKKTREIEQAQLRVLQQEKLSSIGRLAAGVAHEINNPMGFVTSNLNSLRQTLNDLDQMIGAYGQLAQMLAKTLPSQGTWPDLESELAAVARLRSDLEIDFILEDAGQMITESLDGAQRVKHIVAALREFTHPSVETCESVDINTSLENTLTILAGKIPPAVGIVKTYGAVPKITCMLREINQVFYQILLNALQAVGSKGVITLATRAAGDKVIVTIGDTGPGISGQDQKRIFEPFFTTHGVGQGTGLGLNLAYNIVQQHQGTLAVESSPGHGTTFIVTLRRDGFQRSAHPTEA